MNKIAFFNKISQWALWAMFAVIVIVLLCFFLGGDATGDAVLTSIDPSMWQPAYTNALLYLVYALLAVAIITTIVGALAKFAMALKDNPVSALKSLIGLALLIVVLIIAWIAGDDTPINIPGYDGTDNVPFWLKLTDMFLFTVYILLVVAIGAIIVSSIVKKIKN